MSAAANSDGSSKDDWRRNPWVWLIIAIPSFTILGCALTIYLALSHPHTMVNDAVTPAAISNGTSDTGSK